MSAEQPIGVFDSGIGGLSVLRALRAELPSEDLLYVADTAYVPYGNRAESEIVERSRIITRFLIERGAKAVVIACNTATAAPAPLLRQEFPLPIVAMEPALKPAVSATRSGVVGVLATAGTLGSRRFAGLVERFGASTTIVTQPCQGLVELVERGRFDAPEAHELLSRYVRPLLERGADVLILGCTHYPFLRPAIEAVAGPDVIIIDTGPPVARQLHRVLVERALLRPHGSGTERMWTSGDPRSVQESVDTLWPTKVRVGAFAPQHSTE